MDSKGNMYVADAAQELQKITPSGIDTVVVGTGEDGYIGGAGAATQAKPTWLYDIAVYGASNL